MASNPKFSLPLDLSGQGAKPAAPSPSNSAHTESEESLQPAGEEVQGRRPIPVQQAHHHKPPPHKAMRKRSNSDHFEVPSAPNPNPDGNHTARESESERAKRLDQFVSGPHQPHIRIVDGIPVLSGGLPRRKVEPHKDPAKSDPFNLKNLGKRKNKIQPWLDAAESHGSSSTGVQQARGYLSRLVVENLYDAVMVTAGDGTILSVNNATCRMFGYARSELVGKNCAMLMPVQDAKHHARYMSDFQSRVVHGGEHEDKYQGTRVGKLREMKAVKKNGDAFPVELTINPIRDPVEDDCLLIAGYIRDVSDRVAAQKAQELVDREKQMKQLAEYLLGYVNHEIRNPLQGMQGYTTELLSQIDDILRSSDPVSPSQMAVVERDLENLSHLITMLSHVANDVMELRELEADNLAIVSIPCSINAILDTAAQYLSHRIVQKSDKVKFTIDRLVVDMQVLLDPNRVVQVLINFLTNALKYTERGEVVLGAELEQEGELRDDDHFDPKAESKRKSLRAKDKKMLMGAGWGPLSPRRPDALTCRFYVKDTGRGIPADRQPFMFQAYEQVFASDARLYGGTGLGLHLCQLITHRMEGQIGFSSQEGKGSEFAIHLPIIRVTPEQAQLYRTESGGSSGGGQVNFGFTAPDSHRSNSSGSSGSSGMGGALLSRLRKGVSVLAGRSNRGGGPQFRTKGTRFLVVEDVALNRSILKRMLESFGAGQVAEASTGKEAMTQLAQDRARGQPEPDVVFMDVMMPEMNGIEATKAMRAFGITAPIIGVTGFVSEENVAEALGSGMDKVLSKPCSKDEIANTLADIHLGKWV